MNADQPIYTKCQNCGSANHRGYACPCECHASVPRIVQAADWYRIDLADGEITTANSERVLSAARDACVRPNAAIATCRFRGRFAIYATGDRLTPEEVAHYEGSKS